MMANRDRVTAALAQLRDARLLLAAGAATVGALLLFGLGVGIIPNPLISRMIEPEPFAIATWIASAPLVGIVAATYIVPPRGSTATEIVELGGGSLRDGTALGTVGSVATFFAIGCPLCNKIALVLLGTSGAMSIFAPIQPLLAAVSLVLLAGTVLWRLDLRARGAACAVRVPPAG
jgi:hypothetical protein